MLKEQKNKMILNLKTILSLENKATKYFTSASDSCRSRSSAAKSLALYCTKVRSASARRSRPTSGRLSSANGNY